MKKAKINRSEIREKPLVVLMTQYEKDTIQSAADDKGLTLSAFVRSVLKDYIKRENK